MWSKTGRDMGEMSPCPRALRHRGGVVCGVRAWPRDFSRLLRDGRPPRSGQPDRDPRDVPELRLRLQIRVVSAAATHESKSAVRHCLFIDPPTACSLTLPLPVPRPPTACSSTLPLPVPRPPTACSLPSGGCTERPTSALRPRRRQVERSKRALGFAGGRTPPRAHLRLAVGSH